MAKVLIIDDNKMVCDTLALVVKSMRHDVTSAYMLKDGLKKVFSKAFDVVFLDVRMPDGNGLDVLPDIRRAPASPEVIIITGAGDPDGAELAIRNGAWDYIEKPCATKEIMLTLLRALQYREAKKAVRLPPPIERDGIVGNSPKMRACIDSLAKAADSEASVLITGETGTGKELFARAIHANSHRADKNFVVVDCAALPETLVESVLFGHERGAFTGADRVHIGLIKQADGGTLFLDEVGELPLSVQKAFLRVLQDHHFRPLGSKQEVESDFRLVAATNKSLVNMVKNGQFRNDLLFRLRSFTIELPPLSERRGDIPSLAMYHMAKLCERYSTETKGFSPEFLDALAAFDWPGNVRELLNTLERALVSARYEPTLFPKHLPPHIRIQLARASVSKEPVAESGRMGGVHPSGVPPKLRDLRDAVEQQYLQDLISVTRGNMKEACQISGLSRSRLYELLKKHKVQGMA